MYIKAKEIIPKLRTILKSCINFATTSKIAAQYGVLNLKALSLKPRGKNTSIAVVIHLYYTDNWELFKNKLKNIAHVKFDLFITMPSHNQGFISTIKKDFPSVRVLIVPNHGRDVLPFIKAAQIVKKMGYDVILKFHSKKSTHRTDGQQWLEGMLDKLLPSDRKVIDKLLAVLHEGTTGIVGPSEVYYPLTVNFPANGMHMTHVVKRLYGRKVAYDVLQMNRKEYGFFGGTMFWARTDAIDGVLYCPVGKFEREKGQIDGTFAHALERLFCIVPEIEGKKMYEVAKNGVVERSYNSDNIPDWSEDHLK
jgi:rhamnosyltransferase